MFSACDTPLFLIAQMGAKPLSFSLVRNNMVRGGAVFESAELGHKLDKATFKKRELELRGHFSRLSLGLPSATTFPSSF